MEWLTAGFTGKKVTVPISQQRPPVCFPRRGQWKKAPANIQVSAWWPGKYPNPARWPILDPPSREVSASQRTGV
jgi:hypothetical protein